MLPSYSTSKILVGALCHKTKPKKLSSSRKLLKTLESASLEAVLTLCTSHAAAVAELLLSCKTGALSRTFF